MYPLARGRRLRSRSSMHPALALPCVVGLGYRGKVRVNDDPEPLGPEVGQKDVGVFNLDKRPVRDDGGIYFV